MFQSPDFNNILSRKLSEVLEDIGTNEKLVMKRRKLFMLMESLGTIYFMSSGRNITRYNFGSQSEGTTTTGLQSDFDVLFVLHNWNVIQEWSEWEQNKENLLIIQGQNITPGYCFLQLLRSDVPLPETNIPNEKYIRDSNGRILLRNTFMQGNIEGTERHGPAVVLAGREGYKDQDTVLALSCKSWPQSAFHFLTDEQDSRRWPSNEMKRYAFNNGCFVVGASSKISTNPQLEWRISTSLAERCLMFNLNVTQLQCYVLMKMILKSFFSTPQLNSLSSFMCKTVLLHCIAKTDQSIWERSNLSTCLTYCLLELLGSVQSDYLSHFFIHENNLMAGQMNVEMKHEILSKLTDIIQSEGRYLLRVKIDDIGQRLQIKLNIVPLSSYELDTASDIHQYICSCICSLAMLHICQIITFYKFYSNENIGQLKLYICKLREYILRGNRIEKMACRYLLPFLYSTFGSMQVSSSIEYNIPLSSVTSNCFSLGLNSDVTFGRLKLASVFLCLGDMNRTELILRQTEERYDTDVVLPVCRHFDQELRYFSVPAEFKRMCGEMNEDSINQIISCCIIFTRSEINCVPRELQYEMFRSTREDMPHRTISEIHWMNFAVVDALPYLYFLQYKTYGYLQRYQDQQRALNNLALTIATGKILGHRETALNLLGQCMEQENRHKEALQCYMMSLQQRERNNAAKFHICYLLAKYVSNMPRS